MKREFTANYLTPIENRMVQYFMTNIFITNTKKQYKNNVSQSLYVEKVNQFFIVKKCPPRIIRFRYSAVKSIYLSIISKNGLYRQLPKNQTKRLSKKIDWSNNKYHETTMIYTNYVVEQHSIKHQICSIFITIFFRKRRIFVITFFYNFW